MTGRTGARNRPPCTPAPSGPDSVPRAGAPSCLPVFEHLHATHLSPHDEALALIKEITWAARLPASTPPGV